MIEFRLALLEARGLCPTEGCGKPVAARGLCAGCYGRLWREEHPGYSEKYRSAESSREWRAANRDKIRAYRQRRKALERGGAKSFRLISHREIAERDGWRCHICGGRVTEADWSLDHLVPLSAGGENLPVNLALAHHRCNSARGAGRIPAQLRLLG